MDGGCVADFLPEQLTGGQTSAEVKQLLDAPLLRDDEASAWASSPRASIRPPLTSTSSMVASLDGVGGMGSLVDVGGEGDDCDAAVLMPGGSVGLGGDEIPEYGVPRQSLREILRGSLRILIAVWDHWRSKRHNDTDKLPLLSRLRREAAEMNARRARLATAHTELFRMRSHLVRVRRILVLIQRREKLKRHVAAMNQALFEAQMEAPRAEPSAAGGAGTSYGTRSTVAQTIAQTILPL
uniref:Uncharacterized protein n=1 Tax=Haptolina ericina TaxID=156174 RepID=A0A7S3F177_9EUKA